MGGCAKKIGAVREALVIPSRRGLIPMPLAEQLYSEEKHEHESCAFGLRKLATAPSVPIVLVAPVAQATTPKVRGVGFPDVPKWRMKHGHDRADDPSCATCQSVPLEGPSGVRPAETGQITDDGQLTTSRAALSPNPESLTPAFRRARVKGFGVSANIPGVEVWMEPQTSVRRKL